MVLGGILFFETFGSFQKKSLRILSSSPERASWNLWSGSRHWWPNVPNHANQDYQNLRRPDFNSSNMTMAKCGGNNLNIGTSKAEKVCHGFNATQASHEEIFHPGDRRIKSWECNVLISLTVYHIWLIYFKSFESWVRCPSGQNTPDIYRNEVIKLTWGHLFRGLPLDSNIFQATCCCYSISYHRPPFWPRC